MGHYIEPIRCLNDHMGIDLLQQKGTANNVVDRLAVDMCKFENNPQVFASGPVLIL